jgi:glutaredoxin
MFLAIRFERIFPNERIMPIRSSLSSLANAASQFIHRNAVLILVTLFIGVWGWNVMTPRRLFATEGERAQFLSSVGAPSSIRIITLGTEWCPACKQLEHKLSTDNVPHITLDVEKNPAGGALFRRAVEVTGSNSVPKIILDRDIVTQPKLFLELARGDGGRNSND